MTMFKAIDRWVGGKLFVPLIVRFCQWRKVSQRVVANYMAVVVTAGLFVALFDVVQTYWAPMWLMLPLCVLMALGTLVAVVIVALKPDFPHPVFRGGTWWRLFWVFSLLVDVLLITGGIVDIRDLIVDFAALICLYAQTIDTIPPLPDKKEARNTRQQPVVVRVKR